MSLDRPRAEADVAQQIAAALAQGARRGICQVRIPPADLATAVRLLQRQEWAFLGLAVEEWQRQRPWRLLYLWYGPNTPWLELEVLAHDDQVPSISSLVYAADWHEREAEDLFEIRFAGHPALGDFVLHDEEWPEGVAPMRKGFSGVGHKIIGRVRRPYRPPVIVDAPGGFVMPIGPVFSGVQESIRFLLETVGEEIIYAHVRSFYKYRGVEKCLEEKRPMDGVLLAERVDGTAAFAHAFAFCQAVEAIAEADVPPRAQALRVLFAEFERIRSHIKTLAGIVESTGLSVPANLLAALEEELLQTGAVATGHRYLFGLNVPGGVTRDPGDEVAALVRSVEGVVDRVTDMYDRLAFDNSFLDRLEAVSHLGAERAKSAGAVGPIARAAGIAHDLRRWHPYALYSRLTVAVPTESEGDGYARFRVFFQEILAARDVLREVLRQLPPGEVLVPVNVGAGEALGAVEAPSGALGYWVRMGASGRVARCHIITPGFVNWHSFPEAVRYIAFQDFPIILATFGLSVADADR